MEELIIGSHVSYKKDTRLVGCVEEALSYKPNTFMFYTGAPQNTARSKINLELTQKAYKLMNDNHINPKHVIVHAPYIINLANSNNHDFSVRFLKEEISRCEELGMTKLVLHPGSHVKFTKEEGLNNIVSSLDEVITEDMKVHICLETMAGKGTELGNLDEIKYIIDHVKNNSSLMVCLDTCHLNDAGYDLNNFDEFLKEFDEKIGIHRIGCVHINDSKNERGAHKDRHENIGLGYIPFETLLSIIYHPALTEIPKILETPYVSENDDSKTKVYPPYRFEIEEIRHKKKNANLLEDIRLFYKKD